MFLEARFARRSLMRDIESEMKKGGKGDFLSDIKKIIEVEGIKYHFDLDEQELKDKRKPTILASNHFTRHFRDRMSIYPAHMFGNTRESLLVSGIVSVVAEMLTKTGASWMIKEQVRTAIGPHKLKHAGMQRSFIRYYDHIPVLKAENDRKGLAGGLAIYSEVEDRFAKGKSVGIYPEGDKSHEMQANYDAFKTFLLVLKRRKGIDYQIIPASVYYENGKFVIKFSKTIQSGDNPKQDAAMVMESIASKLPAALRPKVKV